MLAWLVWTQTLESNVSSTHMHAHVHDFIEPLPPLPLQSLHVGRWRYVWRPAHVCMYVCMYVCMHMCIYIRVMTHFCSILARGRTSLYIKVCVCVNVRIYVVLIRLCMQNIYIYMYLCKFNDFTCEDLRVHEWICEWAAQCMHAYTHTHTHTQYSHTIILASP
jgi:hypothetical protein